MAASRSDALYRYDPSTGALAGSLFRCPVPQPGLPPGLYR